MDSLLKQGRRASDPGERAVIYRQAQALFQKDMPWVPLYHVSAFTAYRRVGPRALRGSDRRAALREGLEDRMIKTTIPTLTLAALLLPLGARAAEKEDVLLAKLRARVEAVDAGLDGVLGLSLKDLKTGATVMELRPAEPFPTASSIKLAVIYELYRQAEEGRIDLAAPHHPPAAAREGRTACCRRWATASRSPGATWPC